MSGLWLLWLLRSLQSVYGVLRLRAKPRSDVLRCAHSSGTTIVLRKEGAGVGLQARFLLDGWTIGVLILLSTRFLLDAILRSDRLRGGSITGR